MRKALIAGIVASALFAVGAFAAVIGNVNTDNVASGEGEVGTCATVAQVDFTTDAAVVPDGTGEGADFVVSSAQVAFLNGTAAAAGCVGAEADLAFGTNPAGSGEPTAWVDAVCDPVDTNGQTTCTPAGGTTAVRPIVEVAVLANGNAITTDIVGTVP